MAETLTIDNTPETEVVGELSAEEQDSLEVGEQLATAEAQLLAGKFKDAEELEKAYIELQSKLGEPKSEDNEPTQELETEKEPEEPDENVDSSFLDRLWDEAQSEFTDKTMQELNKMSPTDLAQMHLQYRSENRTGVSKQEADRLKEAAGGESKYNDMLDWAKNNLEEAEINLYDSVMNTGNADACFFAIQSLKYRYDDASGVEGDMITGKAPSTKGDQFKSQAQVIEAMNDPRYEKDPAFRKEVADKLERSDVQF